MPKPPVAPRAAPPPFSRQRTRSRLVLGGLVLAVAGCLAAGALITVPTHVVAAATVVDPAGCAAAGVQAGPAGCVLLDLDPARVAAGAPARLTTPDDAVPITLTGAAAPLDAAPPAGAVRAVVEVGRRPLALLFLGGGLSA
jgi:hypothetical protein